MAAFSGLSDRLSHIFSKLKNKGKLSELEVKQAMREVRSRSYRMPWTVR